MSLYFLTSATLGGTLLGFLVMGIWAIRRLGPEIAGTFAAIFLPVYILYFAFIGAAIGALLGFTFSAGWTWLGVPGVLTVGFVWVMVGALWAGLRWLRDRGY
jgi:hypothetical protein